MVTPSALAPFIGDRSPRILAVDDEPLNLKVLDTLLRRWGCAIQTAASGAEALAAIPVFEPDLILLDVIMPGESGIEICRAIQQDPATAHIPVILLTALAGSTERTTGLGTGAADYITKPFNFDELAACLGARLRQKYADDARRSPKTEASSPSAGG